MSPFSTDSHNTAPHNIKCTICGGTLNIRPKEKFVKYAGKKKKCKALNSLMGSTLFCSAAYFQLFLDFIQFGEIDSKRG